MKNNNKVKAIQRIAGIIAFMAVIVFTMAGCDNPTGNNDDDKPFISGSLSSANPNLSPSIRGIARSATESNIQTFSADLGSDNKTLSGLLRDGSITFILTGEYDSVTRAFSMQAPSSMMIFSIVGKLNTNNTIDTSATSASVMIRNGQEWESIHLTVTPSEQSVTGTANADQTGVTSIPLYCRGTLTDQILGGALRYIITGNSITMLDGNNPPQDLTVVEVTNANGSTADENGPWTFIIRAKYITDNVTGTGIDYTGKFYVSKTFDSTISTAIGSATLNDVTFGNAGEQGSIPLSTAVSSLSEIRAYVAPYASNVSANVNTTGIYPNTGYSPLFTGTSATANAKSATALRAISGFTLALR